MAGGPQRHTFNSPSWPSAAPSHTRAMSETNCSPHPQGPPALHSSYAKKADLCWGFPGCLWFTPGERKGHSRQPGWATHCERASHKAHGWGRLLTVSCYTRPRNLFLTLPDLFTPRQCRSPVSLTPFLYRHGILFFP